MRNKISILIVLLFIAAIVGVAAWLITRPQTHYMQGQIEAKQIQVAALIPGRVDEIHVREGDRVKKGDLLLRIGIPKIDAKLQQAKAAKAAAESQLQKANAGARKQQVQAAYNLWQQAVTAADLAENTYNRVQRLFDEKVVPAQKRDEALAKSKALREQANAAKANYEMAKQGTRKEDKAAAAALVDKAQGAVEEVLSYVEDANVYAPANGEVQSILLEQGEVSNAGYPIINLVDLNEVWMVLHVREDHLADYKKGAIFKASVPALGGKEVEWQVRSLAVLGDFATWTATRARGDFDRKTFEIKAYPTKKVEGLRPGMSVLVKE